MSMQAHINGCEQTNTVCNKMIGGAVSMQAAYRL